MADFQALQSRKMTNIAPAPVASGLSTIQVAKGPTYYAFLFRYKRLGVNATEAEIKADIKWLRVKINGNSRIEVSGKHCVDVLNKYYGITFAAGEFCIPLSRPWYKTPEAVENTAWGTRNVDTITIEVEFAASASTPTLDAYGIYSVYQRDLGNIVEVREVQYSTATTGLQEISNLPSSNGDIVALHLDNANITACDIEVNSQLYTQGGDLTLLQNFTKWFALRTPQTGYVHFDAQLRDLLSDGIPIVGVSDFRVKPTLSAAGTISLVMETLNAPLGAPRAAGA